jgi:hypothetical protein
VGGYGDPNLSGRWTAGEDDRSPAGRRRRFLTLRIEAKQRGDQAGIMFRIFGPSAGDQMRALPAECRPTTPWSSSAS